MRFEDDSAARPREGYGVIWGLFQLELHIETTKGISTTWSFFFRLVSGEKMDDATFLVSNN